MKTVKFLLFFFSLFALFFLVACEPNPNKNTDDSLKTIETRDENGHLEEIEYYSKGTLYKTEYYEYLNKHDDESRLVKTIENDQVTYEMEECWKIAYCLQNNTYKFDGEFARVYPNRREIFGSINFEEETIPYQRNNGSNEIYYIIDGTTSRDGRTKYSYRLKIIYLNSEQYEVVFADGSTGDGNRRIFILTDD